MSYAMRPHDLLVHHPALPAMLADCLPDEWVVVSGGFWFGPYPDAASALEHRPLPMLRDLGRRMPV